jgi:hypothetical protein
MHRITLWVLSACAVLLLAGTSFSKSGGYVQITKPFANIYEYLDPQSTIIKQAHKGEYFELVSSGTSWYQVKVKDKVGWLEMRAGNVVDAPKKLFNTIPFGVFVLSIGMLIVTLGLVGFFLYRQKQTAV